jgi:hypothetical protein
MMSCDAHATPPPKKLKLMTLLQKRVPCLQTKQLEERAQSVKRAPDSEGTNVKNNTKPILFMRGLIGKLIPV